MLYVSRDKVLKKAVCWHSEFSTPAQARYERSYTILHSVEHFEFRFNSCTHLSEKTLDVWGVQT